MSYALSKIDSSEFSEYYIKIISFIIVVLICSINKHCFNFNFTFYTGIQQTSFVSYSIGLPCLDSYTMCVNK